MKYLRQFFILVLVLVSFLLPVSCGKKGAPTLKSYEKPDNPSSLRAIHREDKIILQWDFPKPKEVSIAEFILLKSTGREFEKLSHVENSKRFYIDSDFKTGPKYSYKIISQSPKGIYSKDSNIIEASPLNTPSPPKNISFRIEENSAILSWEKAGDDVLYNVYRRYETDAYGLNPLNKTPLAENSFTDAFNINKTAYYTVRSLGRSKIRDEGTHSEELVIDPSEFTPAMLKDLKFFASPENVYLLWKESQESWVTGYKIYRKTEGREYVLIGQTQTPTFLDKEKAITKRAYRVSAVGPVKEGPAAEINDIIYIPER